MSNFLQQLGGLGSSLIDTGTDIVGAIGTNISAGADANQARAAIIRINADLAQQKLAADIERQQRQQKMIETVLFSLLGIGALYLIIMQLKNLKK